MSLRRQTARPVLFLFLFALAACQAGTQDTEYQRLAARAKNVTIIRDNFGVPHVYAKSDADAVFGMLYA
jgi:acyl-homoserine-lactone acylase